MQIKFYCSMTDEIPFMGKKYNYLQLRLSLKMRNKILH